MSWDGKFRGGGGGGDSGGSDPPMIPLVFTAIPIDLASEITSRLADLAVDDCNPIKTPSPEDRQTAVKERKERRQKWVKIGLSLPTYPGAAPATQNEKATTVKANFFKVTLNSTAAPRNHKIELGTVKGRVPSSREARAEHIHTLLTENVPNATPWATDYFSTILSPSTGNELYKGCGKDLRNDIGSTHAVPHTRKRGLHDTSRDLVQSEVVFDGQMDFSKLANHVDKGTDIDRNYLPDEDLKMLNILSWHSVGKQLWSGGRVGRKFFPAAGVGNKPRATIPKNSQRPLYLLRTGFFSSMRPGDGSVFMNINTATSAFYPEITVQAWINARASGLHAKVAAKVSQELSRLRVVFKGDERTSNKGKQRTIHGVNEQNCGAVEFELDNGTQSSPKKTSTSFKKDTISVYNHMVKTYSALHREEPFSKTAFILCLGYNQEGKELLYPADKLTFVPWQVVRGKIDSKFTKDMLDVAKRSPNDNQRLINEALGLLDVDKYPSFGIKLQSTMMSLKGRTLPQPSLLYGGKIKTKLTDKFKPATWNLSQVAMPNLDENGRPPKGENGKGLHTVPNKYPKMHVIKAGVIANPQTENHVGNFIEALQDDLKRYGFDTSSYDAVEISDVPENLNDASQRRANLAAKLSKAYSMLREKNDNKDPSLIVILLGDDDNRFFADIKWWGDCVQGVPTLCIAPNAVAKLYKPESAGNKSGKPQQQKYLAGSGSSAKNQGSYGQGPVKEGEKDNAPKIDYKLLGNLALKLNYKLGGINHVVECGELLNTAVFGADVTHSGKGKDPGCPSLAGVVCAWGPGGRYLASARLQSNNTEFIEQLDEMVLERLQVIYRATRGTLPDHILFYRDGVSESQYGMVKDAELTQIEKACKQATTNAKRPDHKIKITLLVVGKRHHARFYKDLDVNHHMAHHNVSAGLCVDSEIIAPNQFSFYLQSHDSPIGTARSAHYVVIENASGYTAQKLHDVTHRICFTGSRATTSLSVCTPARYADILCDRLRCYMRPVFEGEMLLKLKNCQVDDYRKPRLIWGDVTNKRSFPWDPKVSGTMFYL